jgi:hypothetical protein
MIPDLLLWVAKLSARKETAAKAAGRSPRMSPRTSGVVFYTASYRRIQGRNGPRLCAQRQLGLAADSEPVCVRPTERVRLRTSSP